MVTSLIEAQRRPESVAHHSEIKDPSIVRLNDGKYMMFASIGDSETQQWLVGRFLADHPAGPWQEQEPVQFHDLEGPQLCAPAVTYEMVDGQPLWKMYVQTACFEENGVIAVATSTDGVNFTGAPEPLFSKEDLADANPPVVGLYDASISELTVNGEEMLSMTFSGYRRVGCGDIYVSMRPKSGTDKDWSTPVLALRQEEVSFHNHPDYEHFEWGLEGAQVIQTAENEYLMVGVCFLKKPEGHLGSRQRVFFAASDRPDRGFSPISTPVEPQVYLTGQGENGHPDLVMMGDEIGLVYQERAGDKQPWHLRYTHYSREQLRDMVHEHLSRRVPSATLETSGFQPAPREHAMAGGLAV